MAKKVIINFLYVLMFLMFDQRKALNRKPKQGATLSFNKQVHQQKHLLMDFVDLKNLDDPPKGF